MNKQILKLAIPNVISNITIPLLGMVDLAILGRLESEVYIGGIAIGGMIFNFIYWGFGFLRMGTSGFTAQAYGARDMKESMNTLYRATLVALAGAFVVILLQKPIALFSFWAINGSAEIESLAAQYFYIRIWAAPATLGLYALTGWFLGMQNAKAPMVIAILINVLNVGLNIWFVFGLGMRSDGVALGTVIAQYSGLILGLWIFFRYYQNGVKSEKRKVKSGIRYNWFDIVEWRALRRFFVVNKDIFIRTLCLIFTFSFFTAKSASENDTILAVNTLLLQFLFFFSYLIDGFAYAAEALVGRYVGARDPVNLKKSIRKLFLWGLVVSIPFTLAYAVAGNKILLILTNNHQLITLAHEYIWWVILIPLLTFPAFIWDGIYIGAPAAKEMRNTLLIATIIVFIPAYFISRIYIGNHGLWLAMILFMLARGAIMTVWAKRVVGSGF